MRRVNVGETRTQSLTIRPITRALSTYTYTSARPGERIRASRKDGSSVAQTGSSKAGQWRRNLSAIPVQMERLDRGCGHGRRPISINNPFFQHAKWVLYNRRAAKVNFVIPERRGRLGRFRDRLGKSSLLRRIRTEIRRAKSEKGPLDKARARGKRATASSESSGSGTGSAAPQRGWRLTFQRREI